MLPTIKIKKSFNQSFYICSMEITNQTVEKLANLAQLQFNDTEKEAIRVDLEKMIGFIQQLEKVDTTGVEPLLHISDAVNVLRADVVSGSISREDALLNAPSKDVQFFTVPKVIKK
jgi:aspartyl-tRNA(Asn)/glutamyl-tRNA(Gln) amidotransferase subunit C